MDSRSPLRVVIVDPNEDGRAAIARAIAGLERDLEITSRGALGEATPRDLVIVAYDHLADDERAALVRAFSFPVSSSSVRPHLVVLSRGLSRGAYAELFGVHALTNLVAMGESGPRADDLLPTMKKIIALASRPVARDAIFGLEKYFPKGTETTRTELRRASERGAFLDGLDAYTRGLGVNKRLAALFRSATDELLTNAIFNAPTDNAGSPRWATRDRSTEVVLEAGERVTIAMASDRWTLGISVRDPYGSLAVARLTTTLAKCFQPDGRQVKAKPGGAGLGFYQVLDASSHLVVNVDPGRATEVISLIDISGTYKDFVVRSKSFNVFVIADEAAAR